MKNCFFVLMGLTLSGVSMAADGVIVIPDGRGGNRFLLQPESYLLEGSADDSWIYNESFNIPRRPYWQNCVMSTTPVPVFHSVGKADIFMILSAQWVGDLSPNEELDVTNFLLMTTVENGDSIKGSYRDYFHTGLMTHSQKVATNPDGTIYWRIWTDSSIEYHPRRVDVDTGDTISLRLCSISPGFSASIEEFEVHTYPSN